MYLSRSTRRDIGSNELDSANAWFACALSLIALFLAFGLTYSYGAFFTAISREFDTGYTGTAGLFSITLLVIFCLGRITGPITDHTGPGPLLIVGGILMTSGLVGLAYVQTLWQAYALYSLGIGLGAGCIYVPVVTGVGQWFKRQRSAALGVAVSGIGLGTLIVPPVSEHLIHTLGWRELYWLYAMICIVGFTVIGVLFPKPPRDHDDPAFHTDLSADDRLRFRRLFLATIPVNIALYVPFVLLPPSATAHHVTGLAAASLVSVIGVASVVGRLALGALGNRYDTMRIYRGCCGLIVLSYSLWIMASNYAVLTLFAVLMGVGYGGYIALTPALLAELFEPAQLGRRLGVLYTAIGIGAFIGPITAGWGVDVTGGYTLPLVVLALIGIVGWVLMGRVTR